MQSKSPTVLIVDDEERLCKALTRAFNQEGYQTLAATSGEDALRKVQVSPVDLVITDLMMPGMDGLTLVRTLRTDDPDMKVVILTAYGTVESRAEAELLNVDAFLAKPFDLAHLKSLVHRLLRRPQRAWNGGRNGGSLCAVCAAAGRVAGVLVNLPQRMMCCLPQRH